MTQPHTLYLDNAAATAVDMRVLAAMEPYWRAHIANAGALHSEGVYASSVIERARASVARALSAQPDEIIFTSGGTESNNLAIQGIVRAQVREGKRREELHLITSAIEHSSVIDCFRALEREGVRITVVPVDHEGFVDLNALQDALCPETILVSIIYANNEIGTIERVSEVARVVRQARAKFGSSTLVHTDASQATAWLDSSVARLGVDLMTVDAQKIYGPKGAGCLYRKRGVDLEPILYGGGQEYGLRPGTPPTPLIVGCATAIEFVETERASYVTDIALLRDRFITRVLAACPGAVLNGPAGSERLANNINISFPGLEGEQIVLELDARGIAASSRSACLKDTVPGSYMVAALGKGDACARGAVRFSFARDTTEAEADRAADALIEVVQWLEVR